VSDLPVSPIERPNTYELLAQRLLTLIASGEIAGGEPLPSERELVERFGVGRSSVREALRMLESKGLIDQRGKGRFVVSEPQNPLNSSLQVLLELQEVDMRELFEVREVLEGETAAFAAERRTDEDVLAIAETIDAMAASLHSADSYIDADLQFHLAIARASRNRIALHMMHAIREILRRSLLTLYAVPGGPEGSVAHHRRILDAVIAGDPEAARQRMREHLQIVATEASKNSA
jgi:GntR family transcriptional regulator, transcriptional repressor for pyruvate dehydrogenase complex